MGERGSKERGSTVVEKSVYEIEKYKANGFCIPSNKVLRSSYADSLPDLVDVFFKFEVRKNGLFEVFWVGHFGVKQDRGLIFGVSVMLHR
jgi:hypothetical protein